MATSARLRAAAVILGMMVQIALVALLATLDIGFDHPGRSGLDFGSGIVAITILGCLTAVTLVATLGIAVAGRFRGLLAVQLVLVLAGAVVYCAQSFHFDAPLDAKQYKHLVGRTIEEARQELRGRHKLNSCLSDGTWCDTYNGLSIWYTENDGRVTKVGF